MTQPAIIILQMRPHKAGAQAALARLFAVPAFRDLNPLIVTTGHGWLSQQCKENGIPDLVIPFPKSRSWKGRLSGNWRFSRAVLDEVRSRGFSPGLVVANDYTEALLAWQIARFAQIPKVAFLRTAEATMRDLTKYKCETFDYLYPIGRSLSAMARDGFPNVRSRAVSEGLAEREFYPELSKPDEFPNRILVVGSEHPLKGWDDMIAAIEILEKDLEFPAIEYDFTGRAPDWLTGERLRAVRRARLNFVGRHENFSTYVRGYNLVIHPARMESFGLAPFEILAAGVPLLCSRAGEIDQIRTRPEWLFEPADVGDLVEKLRLLHARWRGLTADVAEAQRNIRQRFMFGDIARLLVADFKALMTKQLTL